MECKTISGDKGSAIHRMDALNFMENIHEPLLEVAKVGCWTVDLTFRDGLPKNRPDQIALAERIAGYMRAGQAYQSNELSIEVSHSDMPLTTVDDDLMAFVGGVTSQLQERLNGHAGSVFNKKHLLALCVSSTRATRIVEYGYADIKKGCEQLSRQRAGCVWTHFVDIADNEMRELASHKTSTALDAFSTRIFKNDKRRHVSALSYSGEGAVQKTVQRLPGVINSSYSKQGALPTHYNLNAQFPISNEGGFP